MVVGDGKRVPFFSEDVRQAYLLAVSLSLESFFDSSGHFDVFVRVGGIYRVYADFPVSEIVAAGLRGLLDDGLVLNLAFGAEVVGEHVFAEIFEEIFLEEHLVELCDGIAKQLHQATSTIFSNSLYRMPPEFSTP